MASIAARRVKVPATQSNWIAIAGTKLAAEISDLECAGFDGALDIPSPFGRGLG
jgi:hypothetical protein